MLEPGSIIDVVFADMSHERRHWEDRAHSVERSTYFPEWGEYLNEAFAKMCQVAAAEAGDANMRVVPVVSYRALCTRLVTIAAPRFGQRATRESVDRMACEVEREAAELLAMWAARGAREVVIRNEIQREYERHADSTETLMEPPSRVRFLEALLKLGPPPHEPPVVIRVDRDKTMRGEVSLVVAPNPAFVMPGGRTDRNRAVDQAKVSAPTRPREPGTIQLATDVEADLAAVGIAPPWPAVGDRFGWADLRRRIFAARPADASAAGRALWDRVKAARAREAFAPKPWEEALPEAVRAWAHERLGAGSSGLMHPSNGCVVPADSPSGTRRFARNRENGCCGRREWQEVGPDGWTYKFGFNFGHLDDDEQRLRRERGGGAREPGRVARRHEGAAGEALGLIV